MFQVVEKIAILLFVVLWFSIILWFLSRGWRQLAKTYKWSGIFSGEKLYFRTGTISGTKYGMFLIVGGDVRGAYFSICLPSRLFPPIQIPWSDIKGQEHRGLTARYVDLIFEKDKNKSNDRNIISGRVADTLEQLSGGVWVYERAGKRVIFARDK